MIRKLQTAALALLLGAAPAFAQDKILNVSHDVGREVFEALKPGFQTCWQGKTGHDVTIDQSHAGLSQQARAILEGLPADVVTFNQETDVDALARNGLVAENWREALPNDALPFYSLPAFLVRKGNPKGIKDWSNLARDDVQPVFPNPKTSGNGRYTYLAAYAYGLTEGGSPEKAQEFVGRIFANMPVFDTDGRASTQTFSKREIGGVLVTFKTKGIAQQYAEQGYEAVTPATSLFAAFPVAVVSENADRNGSIEVSTEYLKWLYTPEAQEILTSHNCRSTDKDVAAKHAADFSQVKLLTVDEFFGGWDKVQAKHLAKGGILDRVFVNR